MDKITRITAEHRANLVAYLDGELDETTTREIEQTLSKSPVARNDIEMLARTWEMLDTLPQASASDGFTVRTLVSLKAADAPRSLSDQPWFKNARRGVRHGQEDLQAVHAGWVLLVGGSMQVPAPRRGGRAVLPGIP